MDCVICNSTLTGNQRKFCSNKCKAKGHYINNKKQGNSYYSQTIRGLKRKIKFINILGGCCSKCGYKDNVGALDFHHIDSSTKEFGLDVRKISNTKEETLLIELNKCIVLCANCHREHHNPELQGLITQ